MPGWDDLTSDERDAVIRLLRETVNDDRFPLSPRIRCLKSAADKLDPPPPRPEPVASQPVKPGRRR